MRNSLAVFLVIVFFLAVGYRTYTAWFKPDEFKEFLKKYYESLPWGQELAASELNFWGWRLTLLLIFIGLSVLLLMMAFT